MKPRSLSTGAIPASQLILNPDNSVYHLGVCSEHIADTVIVVGDPDRVSNISSRFDHVEHTMASREFVIHTGTYKRKPLTVLSTGIGVDNIDIVINELDAAVNIDPETRKPRAKLRQLRIVRLGTCGALRAEVPIGSFVASAYAIGFDGVPWHYDMEMLPDELECAESFANHADWPHELAKPYCAKADKVMLNTIGEGMIHGITITANGFYGPQGRSLRLPLRDASLMERMRTFSFNHYQATNFEMECAGLYALSSLLSHRVLTCCVVLANRYNEEFTGDPAKAVNALIDVVLQRL